MPTIDEITTSQARTQEAINVQKFWRNQATGPNREPPGHETYRPFTSAEMKRSPTDIPENIHRRMLDVVLYLYQANPMARSHINLVQDYTVGGGVRVEAEDELVDARLHAFWNHPRNRMNARIREFARESALYGELLESFEFDPFNGLMFLQHWSPGLIEQVHRDPGDMSSFTHVDLKPANFDKGSPRIELINVADDGFRTGDGIYLALNRAADATRGLSDLLPLADIVGNIDALMFNSVEKSRHMQQWFWDITYEGANQEQLTEYFDQILGEGTFPGAYRLHNERVKWDAKSTDINAGEVQQVFEALFTLAVTGLQIPPHWTGFGMGSARAGAESANEPAYRKLITRQEILREFITEILDMQIDHLLRWGFLRPRINRYFRLHMPPIAIRDLQRLGGAINRVISAIGDAVDKGILDKETGQRFTKELLQNTIRES